ncbi:MAG: transglycosylase SLT domain-containing protein [Candidatus Eremiobacteraeota bacterium]|nr:transglycosylase SLT domain-containing protein [Candidatus Eremiobacteraeota bacterium]
MKNKRTLQTLIAVFISVFILFIFNGCGNKKKKTNSHKTDKTIVSLTPTSSPLPEVPLKNTPGETPLKSPDKKTFGNIIPEIKKGGFTKKEIEEISKDGYLSYFYRRKYSKPEVKIVWDAVNKLLPQYTHKDKLLATRSILAYHWVVYRTTANHNMSANIRVTKKYRNLIKRYSKLHEIPHEMMEGVITWENSGGISRRSWAACVGVGQLSAGAVHTSHRFYVPYVKKEKKLASAYRKLNKSFNFPLLKMTGKKHEENARLFNVAKRHRKKRIELGVKDERIIPECNIEDAAIYLKLLYNNYAGRMDLAISAYHNGGLNNNDIIGNHLKRLSGGKTGGSMTQKEIMSAINQYNLSFIDLWKDNTSRGMLSGLRTVFGHITTSANKRLSLGDESDIYPWKVIAGYAALDAPESIRKGLIEKYRGPWDVAECRGLRTYTDYNMIRRGIKSGWLVKLPSSMYKDNGIGAIKDATSSYLKKRKVYNYYVSPEMIGLLQEINSMYRQRTGNNRVKVPLRATLDSRILERYSPGSIPVRYRTHLQGVAVDIDLAKAPYHNKLYRILKELYLGDRIYFVRSGGANRVCINPRYGKYYYEKYRKLKSH